LAAPAHAAEPIKIGFAMSLTGGLAVNGKAALLAMQLWQDDVNAKGGLLGRPVQLVYYDDQSTPSNVPGIYTKLLDVDKVDLVVGPYATAEIAPAMPVVMQHNMTFLALLGLAVNSEFHYPKYFAMIPSGPNPKTAFTKGLFDLAMTQTPKPETIAIVAADQEFARNASDGARDNAKTAGLKIVYDKTYPPSTTDYTPIVRAINATNPDLFVICSYPPDSVGMIRAINEVGTNAKIVGGGMVGLQATAIKMQLGPALNGIITYDFWQPAKTMMFAGVEEVMTRYQAKAAGAGVDPLGYYMAPVSYAYLQILGDAVEGTKSLDQDKLADYLSKTTFKTVFGDIKFGKDGEWAEPRMLMVQFQGVSGSDIGQFKDPKKTVILDPSAYKSGDVIYPFSKAKM
ncbi:MAG TPA: amino acid ABC transporter substrate-binding protein, partial [Stellaceae bacterium]|nr:amino acid ABC transporter substrate-binding protein [Stellaceae bacterium]